MEEHVNIQRPKVRLRLIVIKNGKLLVCYNAQKDYYFYIGGKLDFGETVEEGCQREIKEELGEDVSFKLEKILYIRDFLLPEENEHSLELFILGHINKFEEVEGKRDPQHDGHLWATWLDVNKLPDNLYPKPLTKKLIEDYKADFLREGEYIGRMDSD